MKVRDLQNEICEGEICEGERFVKVRDLLR